MKILHALVGYLAVTALPFHSFAFASPLAAINYDGYVDTTHIDGALVNHVLGNIVETCQTVTTQNHKDTALMKRHGGPGDIIEARQGAGSGLPAIPLAFIISIALTGIFVGLVWLKTDDLVRGNDLSY